MNDNPRKLPPSLECPIDTLFIDISDVISPIFKKLNFTPNDITTLSLVFGICAIVSLIKHKFLYTGVFYLLSYFFDCMDGYYARKYNMVSKGGDSYDHYKDWTVDGLLILILLYQKRIYGVSLFVIKSLCACVMLGCQEKYYDKDESPTLGITKSATVCTNKDDSINKLQYIRYAGVGSMYMVVILYFILLEYVPHNVKF
jgi:phosphatidylglycerophosphate synthase